MMDWRDCFEKNIAKEVGIDENLINSLLKTSSNNLHSSDELKMDEKTANSKISLAYDSLRELLEALSMKKGYKIYNHECYVSFLKEILNEGEKAEEFNEIRKIRNAINYYGKDISIKDAEEVIERIKILRKFILSYFGF